MKRCELEHVIRAAAGITGEQEFIIIGSQAILGKHPDALRLLRRSIEVDLYPKNHPEKAIEIDGAIGEQSTFHHTFKYYAHGIGPETAKLPEGWEKRLIPVSGLNTNGAIGWCLEPHDLAFSKLAAGRAKDIEFVEMLLKHRIISRTKLDLLIKAEKDSATQALLIEPWKQIKLRSSKNKDR